MNFNQNYSYYKVPFNCPLTEETKGIINKTIIKMKKNAVLINTARGLLLMKRTFVKL
ncbi:MAG: hypothetical protein GY714_03385 [Desulfobacterales bacterium]|nr:hypothetical protein [Desulfobacterales bacterium]